MGVTGKFEIEVDIKAGGDVFHELLGQKPHQLSNITPSKVHSCDLHEGEYGKPGSIVIYNYTLLDGKKCFAKDKVEEIDEEKKYVRYKVLEGDLLQEYKSFAFSVQVIPKGEISGIKWIVEFEQIADGSYPTKLLDLFISVTKDIEAHHLKA